LRCADQDALALRSQQRWAAAHAADLFASEIVPVSIPQKKGDPKLFGVDEHPRPDTSPEALAKLFVFCVSSLVPMATGASISFNPGMGSIACADNSSKDA
jgi:acetyl-CoA acetyltransferase